MIYVIEAVGRRAVKIGYCRHSVEQRLPHLQTGCPDELVVLATGPGDKIDEKRLHRQLSDLRIRGEWFRYNRPIKRLLAKMAAGKVESATTAERYARRRAKLKADWNGPMGDDCWPIGYVDAGTNGEEENHQT